MPKWTGKTDLLFMEIRITVHIMDLTIRSDPDCIQDRDREVNLPFMLYAIYQVPFKLILCTHLQILYDRENNFV